jgi:hypothetical protein
MAKSKKTDDLTVSEAPETVPVAVAAPPLFPSLEPSDGLREVSLIGGGGLDGAWLVPEPFPMSLSYGQAKYDLSDRKAGVYVWKYR